jgi:hypothetical protein
MRRRRFGERGYRRKRANARHDGAVTVADVGVEKAEK